MIHQRYCDTRNHPEPTDGSEAGPCTSQIRDAGGVASWLMDTEIGPMLVFYGGGVRLTIELAVQHAQGVLDLAAAAGYPVLPPRTGRHQI